MVSFMLSSLLGVFAAIGSFLYTPLLNITLSAHTTPAAPRFVIYNDKWVSGETGPPAVSRIKGYNVFALSFWLVSGPADQAVEWASLDNATRTSIKKSYHNAGISLIVSAFGSTDAPTSGGYNPTTVANDLAAFVLKYNLDGVDVDYEVGFSQVQDKSVYMRKFIRECRTRSSRSGIDTLLVEKPGGREGKVVGAPSRKPPALVCPDRGVGACSAGRRPIGLGSNMLLAGVADDSRDSGSGVTEEGREEIVLGPVQPVAGFNGTGARAFVMCRGVARGELGEGRSTLHLQQHWVDISIRVIIETLLIVLGLFFSVVPLPLLHFPGSNGSRNVAGPDPSLFPSPAGRTRFAPDTIAPGGLKGTLAGLLGTFLVRPNITMVWKGCSLGGRVKMCRMRGWKNGIEWIRVISRLPQIELFRVA